MAITNLPSNGAESNEIQSAPIMVQVAPSGNDSIINRSTDPVLNPMASGMAIPNIMSKTVASATGDGAAAITAYFGNEDRYNATATNNGSGAGSVEGTYGDGWTGLGYNAILGSALQGQGVLCYGVTMSYITTSGGAQNPSGLTTANLSYLTANLVGANFMTVGVPLNAGLRNTQYQTGTMTVLKRFFLSSINQLSFGVPVGNTVNCIILTQPQA